MKNKAALAHCRNLIKNGWTNEQVKDTDACRVLTYAQIRNIRFQEQRKAEKKTTPKTTATTVEAVETTQDETAQKQPETAQNNAVFLQFCKEFAQAFHPADLVFYAVVGIGCSGVVTALPGVGIAFSGVWFCIAALYLHRVKMWAKWYDIAMLAVFELLAGFVADWVWANNALWSNIARLPFHVYVEKYQNGAGELVAFYAGKDVEMPAYVACYIAAMLVVFGGSAVAVSTLANRKRLSKKQNDEQ